MRESLNKFIKLCGPIWKATTGPLWITAEDSKVRALLSLRYSRMIVWLKIASSNRDPQYAIFFLLQLADSMVRMTFIHCSNLSSIMCNLHVYPFAGCPCLDPMSSSNKLRYSLELTTRDKNGGVWDYYRSEVSSDMRDLLPREKLVRTQLMVDTTLGRKLNSHIVTSKLSCAAITAVSVWSHVEIMHSNVALSSW